MDNDMDNVGQEDYTGKSVRVRMVGTRKRGMLIFDSGSILLPGERLIVFDKEGPTAKAVRSERLRVVRVTNIKTDPRRCADCGWLMEGVCCRNSPKRRVVIGGYRIGISWLPKRIYPFCKSERPNGRFLFLAPPCFD